jgi:hypothetical protein
MSLVVDTHQVVGSVKGVSVVRESLTCLAGACLSLRGDHHTRVNIVVLSVAARIYRRHLKS